MSPRWLAFALLPLFAALLPAQDDEGRKIALLVGVKDYSRSDSGDGQPLAELKFTENDVNDLAKVLKAQGFRHVTVLTRSEWKDKDRDDLLPTAENIRDHLKAILRNAKPKDTILVALSGHGANPKKADKLFFCPHGAKIPDETTLISIDEVYDTLRASNAGTKVLLVDACRNDPLDGRGTTASVTRPVVKEPPGGTVALFSCSKGQVAHESKTHKRGFLFHYVIEGLGGLDGKSSPAANPRGEVTWLGLAKHVEESVPFGVQEEKGPRYDQVPEVKGEARAMVLARVAARAVERPMPNQPMVKTSKEPKGEPMVGTPVEPNVRPMVSGSKPPLLTKDVSKAELMALRKAWATYLKMPEEYAEDLGNGVKLEMVLIVPGVFWMGSPEGEADREKDEVQHEVTITRPFYMAKYEMTQEQYVAITGKANPSYFASTGGGKGQVERLRTERHPVEQVTWQDATDTTVMLTEMAKKKNSGRVYRLPTEAQWEYTCRGGRVSKTSLPFHFADAQAKLTSAEANIDMKLGRTSEAGSFAANRFGVYDMHGNVYEWCSDWYAAYPNGASVDPSGPKDGTGRVIRGGDWFFNARFCRAAGRLRSDPSDRSSSIGFRVAMFPSQE